jgi:SPP1 gp7 family putative phage head morphogenesis protein
VQAANPRADLTAHVLAMHRNAKPKLNVKPAAYPRNIEQDYGSRLVSIVRTWRTQLKPIATEIPQLLARAASRQGYTPRKLDAAGDLDAAVATAAVPRFDNDEGRLAEQTLDQIFGRLERGLEPRDAELLAKYFGTQLNQRQYADLAEHIKDALGVEIMPNADVRELIEQFTRENAKLIVGIPEGMREEVAKLTSRAFQKRMDPDTFARLLDVKFDIAESRARAIARDQIGLLNGQLNEARQKALGITHYWWITMQDDRVRPWHVTRFRKRFAWDDPPDGGAPGEDFGCRCTAMPDVRHLLDLAQWRRTWAESPYGARLGALPR